MNMLNVSNLNQFYGGSHILRDVSLEVPVGEVTCLLGRNGVGKTTLLKSLMGVVPVKSGEMSWQGKSIVKMTPHERVAAGIAYVVAIAKDTMPEEARQQAEKIKDMTFDADSLSVNVPPVGSIRLRIVDRDEPKCIKFESEQSPIPFNFWIQLLPVTSTTSKMKLTIKAELNMFIKQMVKKPLQEGIEKIADVLQMIQY
jgi:energy-coupling factor transporter ATP-binding protein EcfA2